MRVVEKETVLLRERDGCYERVQRSRLRRSVSRVPAATQHRPNVIGNEESLTVRGKFAGTVVAVGPVVVVVGIVVPWVTSVVEFGGGVVVVRITVIGGTVPMLVVDGGSVVLVTSVVLVVVSGTVVADTSVVVVSGVVLVVVYGVVVVVVSQMHTGCDVVVS